MANTDESNHELRQYLLGLLTEDAEQSVEIRLLTDSVYAEDFDKVVNEITDEYVTNALEPEHRTRVEQYFLKAAQRKDKLRFATAFEDYLSEQRNSIPPEPEKKSFLERFQILVGVQSWAIPAVTAVVLAAIVISVLLLTTNRKQNVQAIALNLSGATRGTNATSEPVKLASDVGLLRVSLSLPTTDSQSTTFAVQLVHPDGKAKALAISEHDSNRVVVEIKASDLAPGTYALQISVVNADSSERRIPGSYLFTVE